MADGTQVDLIYRWINPATGAEKLAAIRRTEPTAVLGGMSCVQRYRDNNELKYSLRSVARHAPWVRAIHILGEGAPPDWLRTGTKIVWIDLEAFLAARGQPMQLNSETQKLYFSRVPGLAERFISFDDDWFLGGDVSERDFFTDEGVPIHPSTIEYRGGHAPLAWTRSLYDQALSLLPEVHVESIKRAGTARIDPMQTMREALLAAGLVATSGARDAQIWLRDMNVSRYRQVLDLIETTKPQTYCINDDWSDDASVYAEQMQGLQAFFDRMYPNAATWERRDRCTLQSWATFRRSIVSLAGPIAMRLKQSFTISGRQLRVSGRKSFTSWTHSGPTGMRREH